MKTETTTEPDAAIEFLKTCHPEWIDEMPVFASASRLGTGSIAKNSFYCEEKRQGVIAHFFGTGHKQGHTGWHLLVASEVTADEFKAHAVPFACLAAFEMGIHPSALISAA